MQPKLTACVVYFCFVVTEFALMLLPSLAVIVLAGPVAVAFLSFYSWLCPRRGVVVCDDGVALLALSFPQDQPVRVIGRFEAADIRSTKVIVGEVHMELGPERVWLSNREEASLREALTEHAVVPVS